MYALIRVGTWPRGFENAADTSECAGGTRVPPSAALAPPARSVQARLLGVDRPLLLPTLRRFLLCASPTHHQLSEWE